MHVDDSRSKFLTVAKLRELLAQLPDDALLSARSRGDTGNLGVYRGPLEEAEIIAAVDFGWENIEWYDTVEAEP